MNFDRSLISHKNSTGPSKMSKKKGLSFEEKRKRMLDIFYDSKDFYLLKELEKIAPKQKGKTKTSLTTKLGLAMS